MKTYNWEGVNPDGYFLDKLEPIPSALPSFQKLFQVSATALDRKSGSAGMPRPISYAVFCLKKKKTKQPIKIDKYKDDSININRQTLSSSFIPSARYTHVG